MAGFLFSAGREQVVLVEMINPEWQRGKLNCVGGKIEAFDDSPTAAMIREFREEAGLLVNEWEEFCLVKNRGNLTHFFRSFADGNLNHVSGQEAEKYPPTRFRNWPG